MPFAPAIQEARENPFFVLQGPNGLRLPCQWTAFNEEAGKTGTPEFEIVLPQFPETIGNLFGLLEGDEFQMRAFEGQAFEYIGLDPTWTGGPDCVLEAGNDFEMGEDGLYIADPEEPAADPIETPSLRRAA